MKTIQIPRRSFIVRCGKIPRGLESGYEKPPPGSKEKLPLAPRIFVCSLARMPQTVRATGARSLVTLVNDGTPVERPPGIMAGNHLFVAVSDIAAAEDGHILASETHVEELVDFARRWDQAAPLLIHCFAGVSRSTAAAFIAACALRPHRLEEDIAQEVRQRSPTATPNLRLIALGDRLLGRNGRMIAAVTKIGRGTECSEGTPFALDLA